MKIDTLIQGDSIEILKTFPDSSVHAIISDIPYGIGLDDWDILHNNTNSVYGGSSPAQIAGGGLFKRRGNPSTDGARLTKESPANIRTGAHAGRESGCESSSPAGRASSLREGVTLTGASLLWKTPASPSRICLHGKRRPLLTGHRDSPQSMNVAEITTMRKFGRAGV